jgi:streptogramin lyase
MPYALAYYEDSVWVTNRKDGTVWRLDPETGRRMGKPIDVGEDPVSMAKLGDDLWVVGTNSRTLTRIGP